MIRRITFVVLLIYLWVMMIMSGSIVMETFMIYPNIFYNPPQSLELAMEFMTIRAPSNFFPLLGFLSWVTGLGALIYGQYKRIGVRIAIRTPASIISAQTIR